MKKKPNQATRANSVPTVSTYVQDSRPKRRFSLQTSNKKELSPSDEKKLYDVQLASRMNPIFSQGLTYNNLPSNITTKSIFVSDQCQAARMIIAKYKFPVLHAIAKKMPKSRITRFFFHIFKIDKMAIDFVTDESIDRSHTVVFQLEKFFEKPTPNQYLKEASIRYDTVFEANLEDQEEINLENQNVEEVIEPMTLKELEATKQELQDLNIENNENSVHDLKGEEHIYDELNLMRKSLVDQIEEIRISKLYESINDLDIGRTSVTELKQSMTPEAYKKFTKGFTEDQVMEAEGKLEAMLDQIQSKSTSNQEKLGKLIKAGYALKQMTKLASRGYFKDSTEDGFAAFLKEGAAPKIVIKRSKDETLKDRFGDSQQEDGNEAILDEDDVSLQEAKELGLDHYEDAAEVVKEVRRKASMELEEQGIAEYEFPEAVLQEIKSKRAAGIVDRNLEQVEGSTNQSKEIELDNQSKNGPPAA